MRPLHLLLLKQLHRELGLLVLSYRLRLLPLIRTKWLHDSWLLREIKPSLLVSLHMQLPKPLFTFLQQASFDLPPLIPNRLWFSNRNAILPGLPQHLLPHPSFRFGGHSVERRGQPGPIQEIPAYLTYWWWLVPSATRFPEDAESGTWSLAAWI